MTHEAKRIRAVYTLLALLAVLLPMTGWFARSLALPSQPAGFTEVHAVRCAYTMKQAPFICANSSSNEPIVYGVRVDYVRR
jgi:hypothetical protein